MTGEYELIERLPTPEDFCRLRAITGLSARSLEAARAGLPNSVIALCIMRRDVVVGIGRVIGDGGLMFQLVDIAVDPAHQGRGLGKAIVAGLTDRLRKRVPAEAYVSLIADGEANRLYSQFGFAPTAPASIGMQMWIR